MPKDIAFYKNDDLSHSRFFIAENYFIMFFPHDAHMPCLMADEKEAHIKKVVAKIKAKLKDKSLLKRRALHRSQSQNLSS